jgi:hypothetical protein
MFFACYAVMFYFFHFFIPYPLSAFHPFPQPHLTLPMLLSPIFIIILVVLLWFKRRDKLFIFAISFFICNLLLVLQVISIGGTLVADRYTYVPYVGLAFLIGMLLDRHYVSPGKMSLKVMSLTAIIGFGYLTFQRTKVWRDSGTLWDETLKHYPSEPVPRTNRANYLLELAEKPENQSQKNELLLKALNDCNIALKSDMNHKPAYANRQNIFLLLGQDSLAFKDANFLISLDPGNMLSYHTRGVFYFRSNKPDSALINFNQCLAISPETDYALNNRGILLLSVYKKYQDALDDFSRAINVKAKGDYYLNRSYCYISIGDSLAAKKDALAALQQGVVVPSAYRKILHIPD